MAWLTIEHIRLFAPCEQIEMVAHMFPGGFEVTADNARRLSSAGVNIWWAVHMLGVDGQNGLIERSVGRTGMERLDGALLSRCISEAVEAASRGGKEQPSGLYAYRWLARARTSEQEAELQLVDLVKALNDHFTG